MRQSKAQIESRVYTIPEVRFEQQRLTSFGGIIVFQALLQKLQLKARLSKCFRHCRKTVAYPMAALMLQLVVSILLGYRRLRDRDLFHDDPLVLRVLGLKCMPDVSTISRRLADVDSRAIDEVRRANRELVLRRLSKENIARITADFDGSVQTTRAHAEGTAVGFNKMRKGARSYYPLFCTVAQTAQLFDILHRPGNVHDSNGAAAFMLQCVSEIRMACPKATIETRVDSAFFNESILEKLDQQGVCFSASVPFERFPQLKQLIETCTSWKHINNKWSYAEIRWKPKCWSNHESFRIIALRQRTCRQQKGPLQLDLFVPRDMDYEYKAIVANKTQTVEHLLPFHNGRGSQEGIFGEGKSCAQLDYVPSRRLVANQLYTCASMIAHNLGRELQMMVRSREPRNRPKRPSLWQFQSLRSLTQRLVRRAARITYPNGKMVLTMSGDQQIEDEISRYISALQRS